MPCLPFEDGEAEEVRLSRISGGPFDGLPGCQAPVQVTSARGQPLEGIVGASLALASAMLSS